MPKGAEYAMANINVSFTKRHIVFQLLVLGISLGFYSLIFYQGIWMDLQGHIQQLQDMIDGKLIRANFMYYLLIYLVGLGQNNFYFLGTASILVVSGAIWAKYRAASHFLRPHEETPRPHISRPLKGASHTSERTPFYILGALLLVFASNLPGPDHYFLGQINPNVWHNSTTILLMPVAIILFDRSYRFLTSPSLSEAWMLTGLTVLSLFIKPSFFFCFGIVFPLFLMLKVGVKKAFWWGMLPVGLGGLVLIGQYYLIFRLSPSLPEAAATEASGVQFAPFLVWGASTSNYLWSILSSLLFPLTFVGCFPKRLLKTGILTYAWSLFLIALLIFIFIAETGDRALHGNFTWQAVVCSFLLFMATVKEGLTLLPDWKRGNKVKVLVFTFLLHVMAGVGYMGKILITGSYY